MLLGKYFRKFYVKYGHYFILGIIALVVVDYFQLMVPDIIGEIIDGLQFKSLTKETLFNLSITLSRARRHF